MPQRGRSAATPPPLPLADTPSTAEWMIQKHHPKRAQIGLRHGEFPEGHRVGNLRQNPDDRPWGPVARRSRHAPAHGSASATEPERKWCRAGRLLDEAGGVLVDSSARRRASLVANETGCLVDRTRALARPLPRALNSSTGRAPVGMPLAGERCVPTRHIGPEGPKTPAGRSPAGVPGPSRAVGQVVSSTSSVTRAPRDPPRSCYRNWIQMPAQREKPWASSIRKGRRRKRGRDWR